MWGAYHCCPLNHRPTSSWACLYAWFSRAWEYCIVFSSQPQWEPNSLTPVNAGDVGSKRLAEDMPQGPGRAHPPTDFLELWSFAPPFNSICDFLPPSMLCNLKGIKTPPFPLHPGPASTFQRKTTKYLFYFCPFTYLS